MNYGLIASIVTPILVVVAATIGTKYRRLKRKAKKFQDLIAYFVKAWEDDQLTPEEVEGLVDRGRALLKSESEAES